MQISRHATTNKVRYWEEATVRGDHSCAKSLSEIKRMLTVFSLRPAGLFVIRLSMNVPTKRRWMAASCR